MKAKIIVEMIEIKTKANELITLYDIRKRRLSEKHEVIYFKLIKKLG